MSQAPHTPPNMSVPRDDANEAAAPPLPAASLLPNQPHADRPLFFVMMIMVFLACLAAIATHVSYRAASDWSADLTGTSTLQIMPGSNGDISESDIERALSILRQTPDIRRAEHIDDDKAFALLQPWLGNIALPEELPVPTLIDIELRQAGQIDGALIESQLQQAGIVAQLDDHRRWSKDIAQTSRAAQLIALTALILLVCAAIATAGFATQSGLTARRTIIDVLSKVGATDTYIARLFTTRFAWIGLKAGVSGALLAGFLALIFWLISGKGSSELMPGLNLTMFDLLMLSLAPFIAAIVCALSARRTVLKTLKREGWQ